MFVQLTLILSAFKNPAVVINIFHKTQAQI